MSDDKSSSFKLGAPSEPMNRTKKLTLFKTLSGLILAGLLGACETQKGSQFVSIFDGRTFQGWEGDTSNTFRIEDGAIIGGNLARGIPRNEFLCTTRFYTNFELRLQSRLAGSSNANGGVQFRSQRVPHDSEVSGYQADMAIDYWGGLYDESRRAVFLARPDGNAVKKVLKPDAWNDYVIRCEGKRIQLWLNGLQTVDFTESDDKFKDFGIIGLQIHRGAGSEAAYRNIEIKELP